MNNNGAFRPEVEWNSSILNPKDLFENPDLRLLCAKKIENQFYDRKSKQKPGKLAELVSAFANTNIEGGLIAVGISNEGDIEGVMHRADLNINEVLTYQNQAGALTNHKLIECKSARGDDEQVLLIYIPYVPNRVIETASGDAFIRAGDQTQRLNYEQRRELEYRKGQLSFEDEQGAKYNRSELADDVLDEFLKSVAKRDRHAIPHGTEEILANCHLIRTLNGENYLTNAGILLLCRDPRKHMPGAYLRFIRYQGKEKKVGPSQNIIKDEIFSAPIPKLIQKVIDFVASQVKEFSYLGEKGKFVTEPEYPEFAWTETIVNALVHRSYSHRNIPVFFEMYDDRIEITSPGNYPLGVSPDQFFHNPRNPHLMSALRYLEFVKMAAEGVHRIKQEMESAGLPLPLYSPVSQPNVKVILRNDIDRRETRIAGKEESTEYGNIFELTISGTNATESAFIEGEGPTIKKIREEMESKLRSSGWAIDSFTNDIAINIGEKIQIDELGDIVSMHPGFRYSLRKYKDILALNIDPTLEVRNRLTLEKIRDIAPEVLRWGVAKGYVKLNSDWKSCRIIEIEADKAKVCPYRRNDRSFSETIISLKEIVPSLSTSWLSYLSRRAGAKVNLYKLIQRHAFSTAKNAARLRSEETLGLIKKVKAIAFPIIIDGFTVELNPEPIKLKEKFDIHRDLVETEPVFNASNPQSASTVIEGLSQYGSYEKPEKEIPIIILTVKDKEKEMENLLKTIIQGSFKYKGAEKTFAVTLSQHSVQITDSCEDYIDKCETILRDIPDSSVFLVYCPEDIYGREDYKSPYFQVKRFLLEKGYPSQMIDEETILNQKFKDFNIALDIFAKSGYVPWVLSEGMPNADLFLGISYSIVGKGIERKRVLAYVNVFDRYGKWLFYRGNAKPIGFEEREKAFRKILDDIVQDYEKRANLQRLHVHSAFRLSYESRKEIAEGVWRRAPQAEISFVHINDLSNIRLYDKRSTGDGTISRGTYIVTHPNQFFISTTGYNELGQKGIGTPRTLEVSINRMRAKGELDPRIYAQHILSLTKLNWASTKSFCRDPITIKYSGHIAYLMAAFLKGYESFNIHPKLEKTPWFL